MVTICIETDGATLILDAVSYEQHSKGTSSLIFYKQAPLPEDLVKDSYCDEMDPYEGLTRPMPVRRIGTQVPNFHIHHDLPANVVLKLGECIGHGRSGIVFKVEPVGLASDTPNANLPPLVAKIGRQHYNKWLLREAYFYEEMKSLQGVAVPWCYGLYRARIPVASGQGFIPWLIGWGLRVFPHHDPGLDEYLNSYQESDGKDEDDRKELENNEEKLDARGGFRDQYADLVQQFEDKVQSGQRSTVVTVLILEEVGGEYLPIGGDDPRLVDNRIPKEITYAYLELSIAETLLLTAAFSQLLEKKYTMRTTKSMSLEYCMGISNARIF